MPFLRDRPEPPSLKCNRRHRAVESDGRARSSLENGSMTTPTTPQSDQDWRAHLIDDSAGIRALLQRTKRIAVLGIKMEAGQPAYYVPQYAQRAGYEIVPVPVYYPDATEILGQPVVRTVEAAAPI